MNTRSLTSRSSDIATLLRDADAIVARALLAIALRDPSAVDPMLGLDARMLPWDTRSVLAAGATLRRMPKLSGLLAEGVVSASQVRALARVVLHVRADQLSEVDAFLARRAPGLMDAEPQRLVAEVEDLVATLRADLAARREQRAMATSFLSLQPRLDGGGALYGEADAESFAAICSAVDAVADAPETDDDADPSSRARQRMAALIGLCEASLAGGSCTSARPRPRFLVSMDATSGAASLLPGISTSPKRLSPVATQTLLCDAELVGVLFDGAQPIEVGLTTPTVPERTRRAVIARDGGCRFPGCDAPVSWSDCHHIMWRSRGGTHNPDNLVLLCRRHHRLMHTGRWNIRRGEDGGIAFNRVPGIAGGKTYVSMPRARPPSRE